MKLALIAPTRLLDGYGSQSEGVHLALVHVALQDPEYADWFKRRSMAGDTVILDNGAYEHGSPSPIEEILKAAELVRATTVVAPDFPGERWTKTVDALVDFVDKLPPRYYVFGVPQSEVGDYVGWGNSLQIMSQLSRSLRISHIGVSILACPNAFRRITNTPDVEVNRLVATGYMRHLEEQGLLRRRAKLHYLGLGHRVDFVRHYDIADSLDTASPIRHGLVCRTYQDGYLPGGKTPGHLDFAMQGYTTEAQRLAMQFNIDVLKAHARAAEGTEK